MTRLTRIEPVISVAAASSARVLHPDAQSASLLSAADAARLLRMTVTVDLCAGATAMVDDGGGGRDGDEPADP